MKMDSNFKVSSPYLIEQLRAQKDVIEVSQVELYLRKREKHTKAET